MTAPQTIAGSRTTARLVMITLIGQERVRVIVLFIVFRDDVISEVGTYPNVFACGVLIDMEQHQFTRFSILDEYLPGRLIGVPLELHDIHDFAIDDRASLHLGLVIDSSVRARKSQCGQTHAQRYCYDSHSDE